MRLFFTQLALLAVSYIVSEQKQIAMMADEKTLSQISHRLFTTSCSEMQIRVKNNADALIFHTALCAAGTTKLLFIAEPNKIWLAIPPALKCLRNGDYYNEKRI